MPRLAARIFMIKLNRFLLLSSVLPLLAVSAAAAGQQNSSYSQVGHPINIESGQQVGDVTCVACTIHIRGQVNGDATAVGGSIFIEDQGQVSGDVTAVVGNVRLEKTAKIGGDATVVGGDIRRGEEAQIGGDVTSVGGTWAPIIILVPFLFLGTLVALVVWVVQRIRRTAAPVAV
jgi:hypothetical protein